MEGLQQKDVGICSLFCKLFWLNFTVDAVDC